MGTRTITLPLVPTRMVAIRPLPLIAEDHIIRIGEVVVTEVTEGVRMGVADMTMPPSLNASVQHVTTKVKLRG